MPSKASPLSSLSLVPWKHNKSSYLPPPQLSPHHRSPITIHNTHSHLQSNQTPTLTKMKLSYLLIPTILRLSPTQTALGINCRGSSGCAGSATGICVDFQSTGNGGSGVDAKRVVQKLINHGFTVCGSVSTEKEYSLVV